MNNNLNAIGGKFCLIQLRFTALLGDLNDYGEVLDPEGQQQLIKKCLDGVDLLNSSIESGLKVIVTSDSMKFVEAVLTHNPDIYTVEGNIAHIDYMQDPTSSAYMKLFVEFFLMSKAECLYRVIAKGMRRSGLPYSASMPSGVKLYDIEI